MNTVLVVGGGGREHALAWKLSQSSRVTRIVVSPGNPGMPKEWERWPFDGKEGFHSLARRAKEAGVSLAVIGPDNPLADGIVDVFEEYGVLTFGPKAAAARIESSKAFAKDVMKAAGVPTARFWVTQSVSGATQILKSVPWLPHKGWVIKADGLAFGKGVQVCRTQDEAIRAVHELMPISGSLVIEEELRGREISWIAFCDGTRCSLLEPARDYKRLLDGNQGPNTGGMGCFSPVSEIASEKAKEVQETIFLPVLREMKRRGVEFRGVLFAGLMIEPETGKIWVLEFNARFGDPETQVLMPRMDDDLFLWCEAVARGDLSQFPAQVPFKKDCAVYVVAAASGYPENPRKGDSISSELIHTDSLPSCFYAGVGEQDQKLFTAGGRVLGTLGLGATVDLARTEAYQRLRKVQFRGMTFRSDIGK